MLLCVRVRSKVVRKAIARVLTVISQTQRSALREAFKNKVRNSSVCARWLLPSSMLGVVQLVDPKWLCSGQHGPPLKAKLHYLLPAYAVKQQAAFKLQVLKCPSVNCTEVPAPGLAGEEDACDQEAAHKAPGAGARGAEHTEFVKSRVPILAHGVPPPGCEFVNKAAATSPTRWLSDLTVLHGSSEGEGWCFMCSTVYELHESDQ